MKTAIVPINKNKIVDLSETKKNYRQVALVTVASKIFELCLSKILVDYLCTDDYQFGFKSKHYTALCIYTVKSVFKCYTLQNNRTFTCFLDASKAVHKINHCSLFRRLIDRKTPIL